MYVFAFSQWKYTLLAVVAALFLFSGPLFVQAQISNECGFSRTLEMGVDGEDVRCLQKFLNETGYTVAETGPGSPGNETSLYRTLTEEAVVAWQQAKNVSPASGVFGPVSQAAYLLDLIDTLETTVAEQTGVTPPPSPTPEPEVAGVSTSATDEAREQAAKFVEDAVMMVRDAEEQVEDFDDDEEEKADLEEDLRDARYDLYDALFDFFNKEYDEATELAREVLEDATDVLEDAGGESDKSEAEDILDDVRICLMM